MRPHEIFASMQTDHTVDFFRRLADDSPIIFDQAVHAAALAMKSRPQYLMKQPFEKKAAAARRCLARVIAAPLAGEILATYFLESRVELLVEWLDLLGLEHEKGVLAADAPESPSEAELARHLEAFRGKDPEPDRELLLRAFAAQPSIDWPAMEALLEGPPSD